MSLDHTPKPIEAVVRRGGVWYLAGCSCGWESALYDVAAAAAGSCTAHIADGAKAKP